MDRHRGYGCTGAGPFTDLPVWDSSAATVTGNGVDTLGASGWFKPTVALKTLTFTFTKQIGSPSFQLWIASLAVPVSGVVGGMANTAIPSPGVQVELLNSSGSAVLDSANQPVVVSANQTTGAFSLAAVVDGSYRLKVDVPSSTHVVGNTTIPITVDTSVGDVAVPAGSFRVVSPTPTPTRTPVPSVRASPHPELAATGGSAGAVGAYAVALILSGCVLLIAAVRRTRRV